MNPAPNLVMVGPMGAGKTSIGRRIAERFSLQFADVDHTIVESSGLSIPEIFKQQGEPGFRALERAALTKLLAGNGQLIASGGGSVLDAHNRALMRQRSFVIFLRADVETQLKRVAHDQNRPLLQVSNRHEVLTELGRIREPLYLEVADLVIDANHLTPSEATADLVNRLAQTWQRSGIST